MRFYRRLAPFKAISFDLDDTLYHNHPVMVETDKRMVKYFAQYLPFKKGLAGVYDQKFWYTFRQLALQHDGKLIDDVTQLRLRSYVLGIKTLGIAEAQAIELASDAVSYFVSQRSDFCVPDNIHLFLSKLKEKYPLIAISNGNVDTKSIGIDHYFSEIYHAGNGLKQKPHEDMFAKACEKLYLQPNQLLHIGDCGANDVLGAIRYGCQTAWVSSYNVGKPLQILPNFELTDVTELLRLV